MTKTKITYEAVYRTARAIAKANPEFIYRDAERKALVKEIEARTKRGELFGPSEVSCVYVDYSGSEPVGSCLFGQALITLGMSPRELRAYEGDSIYALMRELIGAAPEWEAPWAEAIREAQNRQDSGTEWGEVFDV